LGQSAPLETDRCNVSTVNSPFATVTRGSRRVVCFSTAEKVPGYTAATARHSPHQAFPPHVKRSHRCIIIFASSSRPPCFSLPLSRSQNRRGRTGTRDIYHGNRTQFSRTAEASAPSGGRRNLGGS
jgi:hypothetical protein